MLVNPFAVYIISFSAIITVYHLQWSQLYPPLSWDLLLFFGLTFVLAGLLARFVKPALSNLSSYRPGLMSNWATVFVLATFAGEVYLAKGVPLFLVFQGEGFYAREASASHLHAFTFWTAFSTICFTDFMYSRRFRYLIQAALPVVFFAMFVYRGPAIMCVVSWLFVFLAHRGQLSLRPRHIVLAGAATLAILYANGIIGNIRSPGQDFIIGRPTQAFRESVIPKPYFWSYLYSTAPIANLQLTVDLMDGDKGTWYEFVAAEFLPDTVSKYILPLLNDGIPSDTGSLVSRDQLYSWEQPQVYPGLNISTLFGRSYGFLGWMGPAIMFAALCGFILTYLTLIRSSPYRVPALCLLNTLVVFCLFNNMMVSAALLPTLVWPLLLGPWRVSLTAQATKK